MPAISSITSLQRAGKKGLGTGAGRVGSPFVVGGMTNEQVVRHILRSSGVQGVVEYPLTPGFWLPPSLRFGETRPDSWLLSVGLIGRVLA
jgi:hypothetical protein